MRTRSNRRWRIALVVAGALALAAVGPAWAQVEVRNDNFQSGQAAGFQGGFASGEIAAARLVPPSSGQITRIRFLFGGSTATKQVTLHIWDDKAGQLNPGAELVSPVDLDVTGSDSGWQEVTAADFGTVQVSGAFRVGLEFHHAGYPSVARDNDGLAFADRNFIKEATLGWQQSKLFGLSGDWIIRAEVTGGTGGADLRAIVDAGAPDLTGGTGVDLARRSQCSANPECPAGQYCSTTGVCTYDCTSDKDCPGGTCNSLGRCIGGGGGGGCSCAVGGRASSTIAAREGAGRDAIGALALMFVLGAAFAIGRRRARGRVL